MSIFKDDIGLSSNLQKVQTNIFHMKINKETSEQETSTTQKVEDFEKISLSENTQKRQDYKKEELEKIQEDKNLLETARQGLSSIDNQVQEIKVQVEKRVDENFKEEDLQKVDESIKEGLKNIKRVVEDTSFNDIKALKASSYDNTKTNEKNDSIIDSLPNLEKASVKSKEDAEKFLQEIEETTKQVKKKQEEIAQSEKNFTQKVDSIIEFESNISTEYVSKEDFGNKLKETVTNGILKDPTTGRKIQIAHLDEKLILALLAVV